MSKVPAGWQRELSAMRFEAHFGTRVFRCFTDRPVSVDAMFRESVRRHHDRDAIVDGSVSLTYGELASVVDATAAGLRAEGIGRGDRVAMLIGNRREFVIALLALQRLHAIAVPIGIREQAPGIAYVLGHCGARLLLHDAELGARLPSRAAMSAPVRCLSVDADPWRQWQRSTSARGDPAPGSRRTDPLHSGLSVNDLTPSDGSPNDPSPNDLSLNDLSLNDSSPSNPSPNDSFLNALGEVTGNEEDTAVILYTSGTTGRPKGAMLSHLNLVHSALHYEFCMGLTREERSAVAVPMSHVTGLVAMVLAMLKVGGALVLFSSFKARSFLEVAAAQRITHTILVPAMYQLCLLEPAFGRDALHSWRIGAYGGAPMPRATIEALARKLPGLTLMNAYGATETASPATIMPGGLQADHLTSVGVPVPAGDIRVMDESGCEVPAGTTGELWIAGPMVVAGYWNDPQATADAFVGGYWKSGDIGSTDEEGFVSIFDRRKDMLNRGGYKIYSVEVENVILEVPGVLEAAVIGRPCDVLGERVHAVVAVAEAGAADASSDLAAFEERLRDHCAARLADYKVPETWVIQTDPLPRNANGKLMKRDLRPG